MGTLALSLASNAKCVIIGVRLSWDGAGAGAGAAGRKAGIGK